MRIGILSPPGKAVATIRIGARGKVLVGSVLLGLGIILGASDLVGAYHETPHVTVNGVRMAPAQIQAIEQQYFPASA